MKKMTLCYWILNLKNKNGCFLFQFQKYEIDKRAAGPNQILLFHLQVWETRFDRQLKATRKKTYKLNKPLACTNVKVILRPCKGPRLAHKHWFWCAKCHASESRLISSSRGSCSWRRMSSRTSMWAKQAQYFLSKCSNLLEHTFIQLAVKAVGADGDARSHTAAQEHHQGPRKRKKAWSTFSIAAKSPKRCWTFSAREVCCTPPHCALILVCRKLVIISCSDGKCVVLGCIYDRCV